jgi:predicted NAD/FAD-binding protein
MRIAVVGSGIAGLGAAWALSRGHEVVLFEAARRLGGHSNTVEVETPDGHVDVDTGFIVYNERTYPNLVRLFDTLGVQTEPSDMSFSLSVEGGLEYGGSVKGLLAQPSRLLSSRYRRMVGDILRFRSAVDDAHRMPAELTLGQYLEDGGYSDGFVYDYVVPMAAAIWSARSDAILEFPAATMMRFLANHGLVKLTDRPQWRTVSGGSLRYVERIHRHLGDAVRLDERVRRIDRSSDRVEIITDRSRERFDHVVLATHSDQALAILGEDADREERSILRAIGYQDNVAVLHSDPSLMPSSRRAWSSWNHMADSHRDPSRRVSVTYWMNRLQGLRTSTQLFVSLNPLRTPEHVVASFEYAHPQFDLKALRSQRRLPVVQGRRRTWFAGAWCGYGFHEDGLQSGLAVAAALGAPAPWYDAVAQVSSVPAVPRLSEVGL